MCLQPLRRRKIVAAVDVAKEADVVVKVEEKVVAEEEKEKVVAEEEVKAVVPAAAMAVDAVVEAEAGDEVRIRTDTKIAMEQMPRIIHRLHRAEFQPVFEFHRLLRGPGPRKLLRNPLYPWTLLPIWIRRQLWMSFQWIITWKTS